MSIIQFTRIRSVKAPNRAHSTDAGTDFFIPDYTQSFFRDLKAKNENNDILYSISKNEDGTEEMTMTLSPHSQINIPSGIRVNITDKSTYLEANNKSGVATKYRLIVGATVVDASYQGEVHLNLINTSEDAITIRTGQKIVQFIHKHYIDTEWREITNDEYDAIPESDRGDGGFGSTSEK